MFLCDICTLTVNHCRSVLALDTRCVNEERCNYCDMRCDICLQPTLKRFETKEYPNLGIVQCCSEACSKLIFTGYKNFFMQDGNLERQKLRSEKEIMQGLFTIEDLEYSGLKTSILFVVCEATKKISDMYSIPSGLKYIKFWHRSIYKPTCIEYAIDGDFNAINVLKFEDSVSAFSGGEMTEMMHQHHKAVVLAGVPYRYFVYSKYDEH